MAFKFEQLEVWELALEHIDLCYEVAKLLPRDEEYNLKSQLKPILSFPTVTIIPMIGHNLSTVVCCPSSKMEAHTCLSISTLPTQKPSPA